LFVLLFLCAPVDKRAKDFQRFNGCDDAQVGSDGTACQLVVNSSVNRKRT
jgi:hypothetical protein